MGYITIDEIIKSGSGIEHAKVFSILEPASMIFIRKIQIREAMGEEEKELLDLIAALIVETVLKQSGIENE